MRSVLEPLAHAPGVMRSPTYKYIGWTQARNRAWQALVNGPRVVIIVAAPGLGKTLLVRDLVARLGESGRDVLMHPADDPLVAFPPSIVLAIDDAEQMDNETVATIAAAVSASCLLACMPQALARIVAAIPRAVVIELPPLASGEIGPFVISELRRAGYPIEFATDDAIARLGRESGGVPRNLSRLTRAAAFLGRRERAQRLTGEHVDRVVAIGSTTDRALASSSLERLDISVSASTGRRGFRRPLMVTAATIGVLSLGVAAFSQWPSAGAPQGFILGSVPPMQVPPTKASPPQYLGPQAASETQVESPRQTMESSTAAMQAAIPIDAPQAETAVQGRPSAVSTEAPASNQGGPAEHALSTSRVVIHFLDHSDVGVATAEKLAGLLSSAVGTIETRAVAGVPHAQVIRYFFAQDRPSAQTLATILGGAGPRWRVQDFTSYLPKPRLETLEVWIPSYYSDHNLRPLDTVPTATKGYERQASTGASAVAAASSISKSHGRP